MNDLVCLHAAASGPATWEPVLPALIGLGYRVHRPTLLGHHDARRLASYPLSVFRDEVLRELDRLRLDRVTLVGHSFGAFVASMIAIVEPDRVERLVLEEMPVPRRDDRDDPPARRSGAGVVLRTLAFLRPSRVDPVLIRDVLAELRTPQPAWWAGWSSPTLLLAGGPSSHLDQERYRLLPAARTVTVPVGHRIHTTAPVRWTGAVTEFLSRSE
ncbi:alpha/beta fold hydrolase [Pseudonocardiaceae bacterium YIM PH 21723]|nr:alpha/beta fold hydrolase [Pseudonocardiaceae bacterium YIM PH 21723]